MGWTVPGPHGVRELLEVPQTMNEWTSVHELVQAETTPAPEEDADAIPRMECMYCGLSFQREFMGRDGTKGTIMLEAHERLAHAAERSGIGIPCGLQGCDRLFETNASLSAHRNRVHGVSADEARRDGLPFGAPMRIQQDLSFATARAQEGQATEIAGDWHGEREVTWANGKLQIRYRADMLNIDPDEFMLLTEIAQVVEDYEKKEGNWAR